MSYRYIMAIGVRLKQGWKTIQKYYDIPTYEKNTGYKFKNQKVVIYDTLKKEVVYRYDLVIQHEIMYNSISRYAVTMKIINNLNETDIYEQVVNSYVN